MILSELCQELKNWFCDVEADVHSDTYTIEDGSLLLPFLQDGQYFRIVGSVFNDGVHCYDENLSLKDETFSGAVWSMKIPPPVISLAEEIDAWIEKNGEAVASPYQSESWGGYSYSLKSGGAESGALDWRTVFGGSLNRWRKLCP